MKLIPSDADRWGWRAHRKLPPDAKLIYSWLSDHVDDFGMMQDPDWDLIVMQTGIDGGSLQVSLNMLANVGLVVSAHDGAIACPRAGRARAENARVLTLMKQGRNAFAIRSQGTEPTEAEYAIARTIDGWVAATGVLWGYKISDSHDFIRAAARCIRLRIADIIVGSQELAATVVMLSEDTYDSSASRASALHPQKIFTPNALTVAFARMAEFKDALTRVRSTAGAAPQCKMNSGLGPGTSNTGLPGNASFSRDDSSESPSG